VYINDTTFTQISDAVLKYIGGFDIKIENIVCEEMPTGRFLHQTTGTSPFTSSVNFSISNSVLENFGSNPPIEVMTGSLSITNNYFELNKNGNIVLSNTVSAFVSNNVYIGDTAAHSGRAFIEWPRYQSGTRNISIGNSVSQGAVHDVSSFLGEQTALISIADGSGDNSPNIDPDGRILLIGGDVRNRSGVFSDIGETGVTVSIDPVSDTWTPLLSFSLDPDDGGVVHINGGGIQGNSGVFSISSRFSITSDSSGTLSISPYSQESFGGAPEQHLNVRLIDSVGNVQLEVRSATGLATAGYKLRVSIQGARPYFNLIKN